MFEFEVFNIIIKSSNEEYKDFEEYWQIETDYDDFSMVSKKEYVLEFKGQEIKYRFALFGTYIEDDKQEKPLWHICLRLLPAYNLFYQPEIKKIREDYCLGEDEKIYAIDVVAYFELPIIASEEKMFEEHFSKDNDFQKYLSAIAYYADATSCIIAFPMDRVVNKIGTTNWDLLESNLTGSNPFKISLERTIETLKKEVKTND